MWWPHIQTKWIILPDRTRTRIIWNWLCRRSRWGSAMAWEKWLRYQWRHLWKISSIPCLKPPELNAVVTVYPMIQNGLTALQYSAIKYTANEVLLLLEMGANVNAVGFVSLRLHSFKHAITYFLHSFKHVIPYHVVYPVPTTLSSRWRGPLSCHWLARATVRTCCMWCERY